MEIDIKTLILILGFTHLLQVLVFFYQYKANRSIKGPIWWLWWSAAESLGFILILLRNIPELLPMVILLQNVVLLSGTLFIYIGLMRFLNKEINWKFLLTFFSVFLLLHLSFIYIKDDIAIRSANISFFLSLISFITAANIFRFKSRSIKLTANFNASILLLHGCVFAYRTIMICLGVEVSHLFTPTFFNFLPYFDALVVSLLWTFGFVTMLNQRLNSEIAEAKNHFEGIFNTSPDAAIISRIHDGFFIDCNKSFTRISGYTREEIFGKTTIDVNLWVNPNDRNQVISTVKEKGICENVEALFRKKDGQVITGLISTQLFDLHGIPHLISVIRDISDRKKQEEEINAKNEELKKLNAEKDKFFSIIAHDLRNPFNTFLGFTDVLNDRLDEFTPAQIKEIALIIHNSADKLYILLENLLEWSRLQQGSISFHPEKVQLSSLIDKCLSAVSDSANTKSIEIYCDTKDVQVIYGDPNILQAVLRNFLTNGIKFTERGGHINLSVRNTNDGLTEFCVKDSGIGMNQQVIDSLFRLENQVNRKGTEDEASSGLGLILCKGLIEKHGGKIWAESEEGKGSSFYFTIPAN